VTLADLVQAYRAGPDGDLPVLVRDSARVLLPRLPDAEPWQGPRAGRHVVVEAVPPREEAEAVPALAAVLAADSVAVVLLREDLAGLAVPRVVEALTTSGLRAVEAAPVSAAGWRTALVVSAGAVPQRSYLLAAEVPDDAAARLRRDNEWLVEGVALRARLHAAAQALDAARAEGVALRAQLAAERQPRPWSRLTRRGWRLVGRVLRRRRGSSP